MTAIPSTFRTLMIERALSYRGIKDCYTIAFELRYPHRLDPDRLAQATRLLLDAEPILGCRFQAGWFRAVWERLARPDEAAFVVARDEAEYQKLRAHPMRSLEGPLFRTCVLPAGAAEPPGGAGGDRLLLQLCHEVADVSGFRDACALLSGFYNRLRTEPSFRPSPNLTGDRTVAQVFRQVPRAELQQIRQKNLALWRAGRRGARVFRLPTREQPFDRDFYLHHIPAERIERVRAAGRAHQATLNDLMLTAFFRAEARLGGWTGDPADRRSLQIRITSDLRKYIPGGRAGAVCNLPTSYVLQLHPYRQEEPFAETLGRVAAILRQRKQDRLDLTSQVMLPGARRIPYRLLLLTLGNIERKVIRTDRLVPTFTNCGAIQPQDYDFDGPPSEGWLLPARYRLPNFLTAFTTYQGRLTMATGFSAQNRQSIPMAELYREIEAELTAFAGGAR